MSQIRIETDQVQAVGRQLIGESERIAAIGRELHQAIASLDTGAWDGASRGRAEPLLDRTQPQSARLSRQLSLLGRTLARIAAVFESRDQQAARNLAGMSWVHWRTAPGLRPTMGSPDDGDPDFGGIDAANGAEYSAVGGRPFVIGQGDQVGIHPNDISQGRIGDCYLMASLAEIAQQNPQAIRDMIRHNQDGTYTVTLYERTSLFSSELQPVEVVVTPDFPIRNGGPVFARPGDGVSGERELWPMLIEKAYAQQHGGYDRIVGGFAYQTLEELTGVPSERFSPSDIDLRQLNAHLEEGHAVTVSSLYDWQIRRNKDQVWLDIPDATDRNPLYQNGDLVPSHEYYITAVDPVAESVSIRNPWGWGVGSTTLSLEEFQSSFQRVSINPIQPQGE